MGNNSSYVPKYKSSEYIKIRPGKNIYKIHKQNVYWRGQKINADGKTFENLQNAYGKDINNIYWSGVKINITPPEIKSFILLKYYYAKSKNNAYYKGKIIKVDLKSFKINNYGDILDINYFYENGKRYKR